jgi:hypothetical protein
MDDGECEVIFAEGLDPDDPAVRAAFDIARWELELMRWMRTQPPRDDDENGSQAQAS